MRPASIPAGRYKRKCGRDASRYGKVHHATDAATLIIPMQGKPAHAIAGSDFLWKPIMHRTHSSNCHTHRTLPGLPVGADAAAIGQCRPGNRGLRRVSRHCSARALADQVVLRRISFERHTCQPNVSITSTKRTRLSGIDKIPTVPGKCADMSRFCYLVIIK